MRRVFACAMAAIGVLGPCVWVVVRGCIDHAASSPAERLVRLGYVDSDDPRWQDPELVGAIVRAASSRDVHLRQCAYHTLLQLVANPFDDYRQFFPSVPSHVQVDTAVAVRLLARGLRDPDVVIRRGVMLNLGSSRFLKLLKYDIYAALCDRDAEVRGWAVRYLVGMGKEADFALPRIRQAADDPDPQVRAALAAAMANVRPQD